MRPERRPERRAARGRAPGRAGVTLVEVLVTVVLIVVGLLALCGVGPVFTRLQRKGNGFTQGALAAQSRFDSLASVPCHAIPLNVTAVSVARGVRERWSVTQGYQILNVTDSVKIPGLARPVGYLSILPCRN